MANKSSFPAKVCVHSRKQLLDGFFRVHEVVCEFEQFDGSMSAPVHRLVLDLGDAVAAVVRDTDTDELILIRQFRLPALAAGHGWMVEVVAGFVGSDATPEAAVAREMVEEIGYAPRRLQLINTFYSSPGGSTERVFLYYAEVDQHTRQGAGGGLASEAENIQVLRVSSAQAREWLSAGRVVDAKTLVALQYMSLREAGLTE